MYGDMSQNVITEGENTWSYTGLSATAKYYYGTSYSYDKEKNTFTVTGDMVTSTVTEYGQQYNDKKYYTCFSTSKTGTCQRLIHVQKYVNATQMSVKSVESFSAAERAGLQAGDVIIEADGKAITTMDELNEIKNSHNIGDEMKVKINRNGQEKELTITLGEQP